MVVYDLNSNNIEYKQELIGGLLLAS